MSQFTVTHVRKNATSTDPESPDFENAIESRMTVTVRAATPEGASKKAEALYVGHPEWGDGGSWAVLSVEDLDADPEP